MMSPQSLIVMLLIMIIIPTILYTFFFLIKCPPNPLHLLRRGRAPQVEDSDPEAGSKHSGKENNDDDDDNNKYIEMVVAVESKLGKDVECPVCLSVFKEGEQLKRLKVCKHLFHQSCIDTWLTSHFNCPVCRAFVSHHHAKRSQERENRRARVLARDFARDDLWQGLPDASGLV